MAWKPPVGALAPAPAPAAPALVPNPLNPSAAPVSPALAEQLRAQMQPAAALPPPAPPVSAVPPPAPLPPVASAVVSAPPAPPAVAAGAPPPVAPPAPPSRRRGRAPAAAEAAPAAPPAPAAPVAAAPAAVAVASAVPQLPGMPAGSYLAAMFAAASNPATIAALATFADTFAAAGGEPNLFPAIVLNDRGMFELDQMNVEGTDADAPQGKDTFAGVFLGYRWNVVCWPHASERNGPKERPLWQAYIGSGAEPQIAEVVANAIRTYSYTKKEMKGAFDTLGHPRAALELLWYQADARGDLGLMVTRSCATMHSTLGTMDALMAALPRITDAAGVPVPSLAPFPAIIGPSAAAAVQSKGQSWEEFHIAIAQQATGDGLIALQKFQEWLAKGGYTAEVDAAIQKWSTSTISDEQCNTLYGISQLRK